MHPKYMVVCSMHTGNHTHKYMIAACTNMHPKYMVVCSMHTGNHTHWYMIWIILDGYLALEGYHFV